ncbi:3-oxoacyl-ACP reductase FabG [Kitasatospora sp. NPDC088160]|uniref:3-oxoacyl-ACP reductase FabG n=1 Tax=Kitasatospora sp. NPDC088160 TaxID=3364072 RepID=UPI00381034F2
MSRSVLVTGASRGIGLAIAQAYHAAGDRVAITYRSTPAPDGFLSVPCDITQPNHIETAFAAVEEQHGPVEVLVSNAGITRDKLLLTMSEDDFTSVLDTNLTGAYRVAKLAARRMIRRREGRILFISSASALYGQAGQSNYTASKAGLIGFARSLARELAPRGITVNTLSPGLTDTAMLNTLGAEKVEGLAAQVPLGRLARPEEIARAALFLTSPDAGYITGQVLAVDGGVSMGH